jgi:hypothetical protein
MNSTTQAITFANKSILNDMLAKEIQNVLAAAQEE